MPATPRVRLNPAQRKEQLLDLGVKLLSVKRLEELSIDALSEVAGISRGLLYHYFSNKREFHLAVLRRMSEQVYEMTAPRQGGTPAEQLVGSIGAYVDFVAANTESYISFVKAAAGGDEEYAEIYRSAQSALTDRIFKAADAETLASLGVSDTPAVRLMVRGWSALVEETTLAWLEDDRGITRDQLVEMLAASLMTVGHVAHS